MLEYNVLDRRVRRARRELNDHIRNTEYIKPESPYVKNLYAENQMNLEIELEGLELKLKIFREDNAEHFI